VSEKMFSMLAETAVADLATALVRRRKMTECEALEAVYGSAFYQKLLNPKTGLVLESPAALFDLFQHSAV